MSHGLPALWPLVIAAAGPAMADPAEGERPRTALRFEVRVAREVPPRDGRLFVVLARSTRPEPRYSIGRTGRTSPPVLARDVDGLAAGMTVELNAASAIFPIE